MNSPIKEFLIFLGLLAALILTIVLISEFISDHRNAQLCATICGAPESLSRDGLCGCITWKVKEEKK